MSRFNLKTSAPNAMNLAGGMAFTASPKLELASLVLTSFVQDQYYRNRESGVSRLIELIAAIPDYWRR